MSPLTGTQIRGTWASLLLPVRSDESIDFQKLGDEIDILIASGIDGIYSNGTAGEFYNQTEEEFDKISVLLAEKCTAAGMKFQIGCSHMSPQISLERINRVVLLEPGAIQVILPDWYPVSNPEIILFLEKMSHAASGIGLVMYNPSHAKTKLSAQDFFELQTENINLVGCKLGGGDPEWYSQFKTLNPELSLFVPGHRLATGITLGAHGSYSNVACINPVAAKEWYDCMLTDIDKALELESRIQLFINSYIIPYITEKKYSDQSVDKLLAAIGGWADIGTRLRWPYKWIDESEAKRLRAIGREALPEFFRTYANG